MSWPIAKFLKKHRLVAERAKRARGGTGFRLLPERQSAHPELKVGPRFAGIPQRRQV